MMSADCTLEKGFLFSVPALSFQSKLAIIVFRNGSCVLPFHIAFFSEHRYPTDYVIVKASNQTTAEDGSHSAVAAEDRNAPNDVYRAG